MLFNLKYGKVLIVCQKKGKSAGPFMIGPVHHLQQQCPGSCILLAVPARVLYLKMSPIIKLGYL
jgi:hypothetical protein